MSRPTVTIVECVDEVVGPDMSYWPGWGYQIETGEVVNGGDDGEIWDEKAAAANAIDAGFSIRQERRTRGEVGLIRLVFLRIVSAWRSR